MEDNKNKALCKVHELKKAFNRLMLFQQFKIYICCDGNDLLLGSLDEDLALAFKVEQEDATKEVVCLNHNQVKALSEFFKEIRVRRNCFLTFNKDNEGNVLNIGIDVEGKNGEIEKSKKFEVNSLSNEEIDEVMNAFTNKEKGDLINVDEMILFANSLKGKSEYVPSSQYVCIKQSSGEINLYYGMNESAIRYRLLSKSCNDEILNINVDFFNVVLKLFRETLSTRANVVIDFQNKNFVIDADSFVLKGKSIGAEMLGYDKIFENIQNNIIASNKFPNKFVEQILDLKKNKEKETVNPKYFEKKYGYKYYEPEYKGFNFDKAKIDLFTTDNEWNYILFSGQKQWPQGIYYYVKPIFNLVKGMKSPVLHLSEIKDSKILLVEENGIQLMVLPFKI